MKLESYWLFKGILLMFNFILVVSTGYILLFSICPMLKPGKIQSIASSTTLENLVKNYFKGAKKLKSEERQGNKTQICSKQWEFELSNLIFYKFRSEGSFALKVVCEIFWL